MRRPVERARCARASTPRRAAGNPRRRSAYRLLRNVLIMPAVAALAAVSSAEPTPHVRRPTERSRGARESPPRRAARSLRRLSLLWNVSLFPSVAAAASAAEPKSKKTRPPPQRAGCATAGGGGGDGALAVWMPFPRAGGKLHRTGKTPHREEAVLAWQNRFTSSRAPASCAETSSYLR